MRFITPAEANIISLILLCGDLAYINMLSESGIYVLTRELNRVICGSYQDLP